MLSSMHFYVFADYLRLDKTNNARLQIVLDSSERSFNPPKQKCPGHLSPGHQ
jgi:hypothetical protein